MPAATTAPAALTMILLSPSPLSPFPPFGPSTWSPLVGGAVAPVDILKLHPRCNNHVNIFSENWETASMDLSQNITYERTRNKIPNEDSYLAAGGSSTMLVQRKEEKSSKRHFSKRESVFSTSRQENKEPHARYAKEELGEKQRRNAFLTFCNKPFHRDESRSNINNRITL
jgi:hypothetical protein